MEDTLTLHMPGRQGRLPSLRGLIFNAKWAGHRDALGGWSPLRDLDFWQARERSDWQTYDVEGVGGVQIDNGPVLQFGSLVALHRRRNSRGLEAKVYADLKLTAHFKGGRWHYLDGPAAGRDGYSLRLAPLAYFDIEAPEILIAGPGPLLRPSLLAERLGTLPS